MDVQIRVNTITPETSAWSIPVTLYCANFPEPAAAPRLILANKDIIQIEWDLPVDNGGSSVLGFFLYMKASTDSSYTLVLDAGENPTIKSFTTTKTALGAVITPDDYQFAVKSRNLVGTSTMSPDLIVTVPYVTSSSLSLISGDGLIGGRGGVTSTVSIQALDESGAAKTTGGDFFFLHVEQLCQTSPGNYRCDLNAQNTNIQGVPIIKLFTDNGDGTYSATYLIREAGKISVSVVLARQGGMYAEYFNNAFLDGPNVLSKVDN